MEVKSRDLGQELRSGFWDESVILWPGEVLVTLHLVAGTMGRWPALPRALGYRGKEALFRGNQTAM